MASAVGAGRWWMKRWPLIRNVVLFTSGLVGTVTLTVTWLATQRPPDPQLILLFTAMMGLPAFLSYDEKYDEKDGDDR